MFNLVSSFGSKRDDYGVGDLLAEVSKRSSSISAEDREEIANISRRLREHKQKNGSSNHTPIQTPDSSEHDGKTNYGKDLLKVESLLRGFSHVDSSPLKSQEAPVSPPTRTIDSTEDGGCDDGRGVMLRGFGHSSSEDDSSAHVDSCGFGQARNL